MANVVKFAIPERKIDNTGVTFSRSHDGYKHGDIRQNFIAGMLLQISPKNVVSG